MDEGVTFTTTDTGTTTREGGGETHSDVGYTNKFRTETQRVRWVTDEMDLKSHGF